MLLLSFCALSVRSQGLFEEKYDACLDAKPCLYCGDTLPQLPYFFRETLRRKIEGAPHGYDLRDGKILYEILIDSTGHPCVISIDDHVFCWNMKNDILVATNDMRKWTPAVLNGHRINATIVMQFDFLHSKYTYHIVKLKDLELKKE